MSSTVWDLAGQWLDDELDQQLQRGYPTSTAAVLDVGTD